jgi:small subunit ribosomal protein S1
MLEVEAHERRKHALTLLQEGQVMHGVVRTVVDWGAFVALPEAENLEGLVHVSEASHDPRANCLELFKPGEKLEVKITKIDERGKIWLSRKALIEDPWAEAKLKYAPGTVLKGKVSGLQPFGACSRSVTRSTSWCTNWISRPERSRCIPRRPASSPTNPSRP